MFHSTRRQRASQCQLSVYILTLDTGKRPQKQAVSSSSCSLPLGGTWMGEAKHGLERTKKHRMCSDFNRVCPGPASYSTRPKPGCKQNSKMNIAADVTVALFAFLVPICMWSCWLETLQHIQVGYHTHISLP